MRDPIKELLQLCVPPRGAEEFQTWLTGADALTFLRQNAVTDEFILYAVLDHAYLNTVVVPNAAIENASDKSLLEWDFNATHGWGISHSSTPESLSVSPPLSYPGSEAYARAEQLIYVRFFDGRLGDKSYIEMLQRFIQLFDLHFIEERLAYCRIDERGDIEDAVRIVRKAETDDSGSGTAVTCRRDLLDQYMTLTESVLARTFDFTRYREGDFCGWPGKADPIEASETNIYYRLVLEGGYGSYLRGVQLVSSRLSKEALFRRFDYNERTNREYASFIAQDFKNNTIREISTAPGATANYFTESDLPFETSPVFFRPDVLQKYKGDTDKYR